MFGKLVIKAEIEVLTGMHIGGSSAFSAIGAVDSPVIRDARTKLPIIPGSSIKGKLRTLLQKSLECSVLRHEPDKDSVEVKRIFGSSEKGNIKRARLQFCDCMMINKKELEKVGYTEVKSENNITRLTAMANPRQIERVISGAKFGFNAIYDLEDENEYEEDFINIAKAFMMLEMDYLGGHGTRGYGRIKFNNFEIEDKTNTMTGDKIIELEKILKGVE